MRAFPTETLLGQPFESGVGVLLLTQYLLQLLAKSCAPNSAPIKKISH